MIRKTEKDAKHSEVIAIGVIAIQECHPEYRAG